MGHGHVQRPAGSGPDIEHLARPAAFISHHKHLQGVGRELGSELRVPNSSVWPEHRRDEDQLRLHWWYWTSPSSVTLAREGHPLLREMYVLQHRLPHGLCCWLGKNLREFAMHRRNVRPHRG